ncbi:MAG: ferredoxin--NADP reductase [Rhodospirillales bacterium]|nr:ferredoxin--NADP reductase [Rhodospirillales bacterium]
MSKFEYNATVIECIEVTGEIKIYRVRMDDGHLSFKAGQYTMLGLLEDEPRIPEAALEEEVEQAADPMIRRAYSISSGSIQADYIEFYVSLVSNGALTPRLFTMRKGSRLFVGPKAKGLFTLDKVPEESHVLMVATGTGLAPYISMLRSRVLADFDRKIAVLHGASYSWDLGYRRELESLSASYTNFSYVPVVSRPKDDPSWGGRTGRLPPILDEDGLDELCGFPISGGKCHVFLCGNPAMIEDAEQRLLLKQFVVGKGREKGDLHMEKYW